MSYGLATFFADGTPNLVITDRLSRFIQTNYVYLGPSASANIGVSGMAPDGTWGIYSDRRLKIIINYGYYTVINSISWADTGGYLTVFRW